MTAPDPWKDRTSPLEPVAPEQRQQEAAIMAKAVAQMIEVFGGLPSTAHKVAAIIAEEGEPK